MGGWERRADPPLPSYDTHALPTKGGGWLDSEEPASPGFPRRAGRAGEEEGRGGVVAGWERKGMVRKGEYRDGGWWLCRWWVVNAVLGIVDGILKIVHFLVCLPCYRLAIDPRETREKHPRG